MQVRNPRRLKKAIPANRHRIRVRRNLHRRKRPIPEHRRMRVRKSLHRLKRPTLEHPQIQGQGRNLHRLKKAIPANRHRIQVRKRRRQKRPIPVRRRRPMMAAVKTQVNPPRPLTTVHPKMTARRPMNRATGRLVVTKVSRGGVVIPGMMNRPHRTILEGAGVGTKKLLQKNRGTAVKLAGGVTMVKTGHRRMVRGTVQMTQGATKTAGRGLKFIVVGGVALGGLLSPLALAGAPTDSRTQSSVGEQRLVSFFFSSDAWGGVPFSETEKQKVMVDAMLSGKPKRIDESVANLPSTPGVRVRSFVALFEVDGSVRPPTMRSGYELELLVPYSREVLSVELLNGETGVVNLVRVEPEDAP